MRDSRGCFGELPSPALLSLSLSLVSIILSEEMGKKKDEFLRADNSSTVVDLREEGTENSGEATIGEGADIISRTSHQRF